MSLISNRLSDYPDTWPKFYSGRPREKCFYCHERIEVGVMWMGGTGDIELHAPCAMNLAIRLMRDVHQLQCETGTELK